MSEAEFESRHRQTFREACRSQGIDEGKWYTVYGVATLESKVCYLVHLGPQLYFPHFVPFHFFAELKGVFPPCLVPTMVKDRNDQDAVIISGSAFSQFEDFYYNLLEGDGKDAYAQAWREFRSYVDRWEEVDGYRHEHLSHPAS
jgi:hypothetical protein